MSWIILEGLDRTGKSTVAQIFEKQGYEIVHMSAPDSKYFKDGYAGPLYIDEVLELYMAFDNQKVIFDRSPYGETVWPHVYGRKPMLNEDDFEVLREFEDKNAVQRILMIDPNAQAHWERCVADKEPMNQQQFKVASALFNKMAHKYNFVPQELGNFDGQAVIARQDPAAVEEENLNKTREDPAPGANADVTVIDGSGKAEVKTSQTGKSQEQEKLEKANAINSILSKRIVRQKGIVFDRLEADIQAFLQSELSLLLGSGDNTPSLSEEEVQILKLYCQRIKEKSKETGR